MSGSAVVLLCGRLAGLELDGLEVTLVDELCRRPEAAAEALRAAGATRAVLGVCEGEGSVPELHAACRRAGAAPFGVEVVALPPHADATRLLESRLAKLGALPAGERGKPAISGDGYSRRALFSLAPAVSVSTVAVLEGTACVGTARCGLCVAACPHEAIAGNGGRPVVDASRCEPCGRCVPACPTGALRLAGSSTRQIEAQLRVLLSRPVEGIVFACARSERKVPAGWFEVELPALSLVTAGWVLQTLAAGAPEVRLAPCGGECCEGAERVLVFCDRLLSEVPAQAGRAAAALTLREPRATVEALTALVPDGLHVEDEASPLGLLELAPERCTVCGACATACPTRAIVLDEGGGETALRFDAALCVPCSRCVDTCPEDALEVHAGVDAARLRSGPVTLILSERETCRGCGAELPPLPMRRRIRELLADTRPDVAEAPLDLCAGCLFAGRTP